jgi:hypothetical protein
MRFVFLLFFSSLISVFSYSQKNGVVKGTLIDTSAKQTLADATITILDAKDSSLVSFARSDKSGNFTIKGLDIAKYRLLVTHVGYRNINKNFIVSNEAKEIDLGYLPISTKSDLLGEVTVVQEVPPVSIRNDTLEYNAGSFKTKPNAVVEDLLKKLPGVQVDKDGTVRSQGEKVQKVLVDGKPFFGNDPKIATKNLPADAVDKVQVFDKKSDQSAFTGFDDGNSQKTINLTLKPEKKNGLFGKASAGAGDKERYQGNFNINKFSGEQQLSAIGMANNTNKQGFSFQDILNFTGGMQGLNGGRGGGLQQAESAIPIQGLMENNQAITTTTAAGINYNDTWNKKTEFNSSYFYNRTEDEGLKKTTRQYLLPTQSYTQTQDAQTEKLNQNHRLNLSADHKIDSFNTIKFSSYVTWQQSESNAATQYNAVTAKGQMMNDGISNSYAVANGYNWNNNVLYRHRFAAKGRTLSANISFGLNNGDIDGSLKSLNRFYENGLQHESDTIDQVYNQVNKGYNYGAVISYTEPLSKKSLLEFNYNFNLTQSESGKETFDMDPLSGKYLIPNVYLTNDFDNNYSTHRETMSWRFQDKKYTATVGTAMQQSLLKSDFTILAKDSVIRNSYVNFLPNARLQYNINRYRNIRLNYFTFTQQPSVLQLQPVPDNSDPLNIKIGNPTLDQEYRHNLQLNYVTFDPFQRTSFFTMLGMSATTNKIVNYDRIDSTGVRITMPVNVNGVYNVNGNIAWAFPVKFIKSSLNLNTTIRYDHNINFVNQQKNGIDNWTVSQSADLNFVHKEQLDITAGASLDYTSARYSLQPSLNTHYWLQEYRLDANIYLPKGFSIENDISYTHRTGYGDGFNQDAVLWNAGMAKQIFKSKKGQIRLQMMDILNQNIGISRTTNQNYIEDVAYKVLNRYWLLSFTYNISRFAGKSAPVQRDAIKVTMPRR